MDMPFLYAVSLTALLVFFTCRQIGISVLERCRYRFRSHVNYPLAWQRGESTQSVTRLDAVLLVCYLGTNGVVLGLALSSKLELARRAAFMSLANLVPLYLGGKTNPLMSYVGFPLPRYYLSHHWFGRVAIAQATLHAALRVSQGITPTVLALSISGSIATLMLIVIGIWSFCLLRRLNYALFAFMHTLLALSVLGAIAWHALIQTYVPPKFAAICACSLWFITSLGRFSRALYRGRVAMNLWQDGQVVRARAQLHKPARLFPGCYFYLYFPDAPMRRRFRGQAMTAAWWDDVECTGHSARVTFLLQRQGNIAVLAKGEKYLQAAYLDGPYGHDLKLQEFENIFLAAKGIGITGILPYAMDLAQRQRFDEKLVARTARAKERTPKEALFRDKTRRIDLFWVLDDNSQQKWLREELQALKNLDPRNRLLCIWCIYPSPAKSKPPFEINDYWRCLYPTRGSDFHKNGIFKEIAKGANSPGRTIVVACGDASFTGSIRDEVIRNASMQFAEVEFRPSRASQESLTARATPLKRLRKRRSRVSDPESLALARDGYESPEYLFAVEAGRGRIHRRVVVGPRIALAAKGTDGLTYLVPPGGRG